MVQKKEINSTSSSGNLQPEHFSGNYTSIGGNYFQHSELFHIVKVCERKKLTANKPPLYIVSKTIDNKFNFISSLYPLPLPNTYTAEVSRKYFKVVKTDLTLTIHQK